MFNKILSKEFWISPYTLAGLGIVFLFIIDLAPVAFIITGLIFGILSKKLIGFKNLLKFALAFSLIQLLINIFFVMAREFDYFLFAPEIYLKRIFGYFTMSFILGSIIFFIVNLIIYGIYLLIKKIKTKKNKI